MFSKRINRLRSLFESDSQAALITNEINVGYFSGFQKSEGAFLVTNDRAILFVDFRYIEAAQKKAKGVEVVCFKSFLKDIGEYLKQLEVKSLYLEASDITLSKFQRYKKAFDELNVECITSSALDEKIRDLRIVKDKTERDKILKAQRIAEKAYLEVLNYIKPGAQERKIALELEYLMKQNGAQDISFDLITITGKKTSLPHGVPTDGVVREGDFFTMDFGAVYDGYHSDTTRTLAVKSVSDEQRQIYEIVLKAQNAALEKIKAGAKGSEVDKAARDIISQAGYGEYFGHSTGHGVGLEIHEAPVASPKSDTVLKSGMIITDEPGIYLPDRFGVRIEDMVCVCDNGCENLVSLPKNLIIV